MKRTLKEMLIEKREERIKERAAIQEKMRPHNERLSIIERELSDIRCAIDYASDAERVNNKYQ